MKTFRNWLWIGAVMAAPLAAQETQATQMEEDPIGARTNSSGNLADDMRGSRTFRSLNLSGAVTAMASSMSQKSSAADYDLHEPVEPLAPAGLESSAEELSQPPLRAQRKGKSARIEAEITDPSPDPVEPNTDERESFSFSASRMVEQPLGIQKGGVAQKATARRRVRDAGQEPATDQRASLSWSFEPLDEQGLFQASHGEFQASRDSRLVIEFVAAQELDEPAHGTKPGGASASPSGTGAKLRLAGGEPGGRAVLVLGGDLLRGEVVAASADYGQFDADGNFDVDLPQDAASKVFFAQGMALGEAGTRSAPTSRAVKVRKTDEGLIDLEPVEEQRSPSWSAEELSSHAQGILKSLASEGQRARLSYLGAVDLESVQVSVEIERTQSGFALETERELDGREVDSRSKNGKLRYAFGSPESASKAIESMVFETRVAKPHDGDRRGGQGNLGYLGDATPTAVGGVQAIKGSIIRTPGDPAPSGSGNVRRVDDEDLSSASHSM